MGIDIEAFNLFLEEKIECKKNKIIENMEKNISDYEMKIERWKKDRIEEFEKAMARYEPMIENERIEQTKLMEKSISDCVEYMNERSKYDSDLVCEYIEQNEITNPKGRYLVYQSDCESHDIIMRTDNLNSLIELCQYQLSNFECFDLETNKNFSLYEYKKTIT